MTSGNDEYLLEATDVSKRYGAVVALESASLRVRPGESHALMAFSAVVIEPAAFEEWLAQQAADAGAPATPVAARGQELFDQVGCGACHTVRGTTAQGTIGPDLTHLAGRSKLAAGVLPNSHEALVRWITQTETIKPGSRMPSFGALPADHVEAIASYLEGLE